MDILSKLKGMYEVSAQERRVKHAERGQRYEQRMGGVRKFASLLQKKYSAPNNYIQNKFKKAYYTQEAIKNKAGETIGYKTTARKISPRLTQAIASIGGVRVPGANRRINKGYGRKGRPREAYDQRYAQYGGVYGYRKAMSYQRRMALLKAQSEMQKNMQNPAYARQMAQQRQFQPQGQQQMPQSMPEYVQNQYPQQQQMPQQAQPQQPQPTGVKLWDDTFMKLDTGQSNIQKPSGGSMWAAFNPDTPSGTPDGDYYTEPDFFSGKQVMRRRSGDRLFKW